jgi:hypothetical protein
VNRGALRDALGAAGVRSDAYCFDSSMPTEQYCLNYDGRVWEAFYGERGLKTSLQTFETESDACDYLYQLILRDESTRRHP